MVGQTRLQPRHDRSVIQGTKHPTTPHDQPPTSITATRKLLTPYDTARFGPRLCLWAWVLHPIRRQCTRSDRVQRPVRGAVPGMGVAARTMVELVTLKRCAISGSNALASKWRGALGSVIPTQVVHCLPR